MLTLEYLDRQKHLQAIEQKQPLLPVQYPLAIANTQNGGRPKESENTPQKLESKEDPYAVGHAQPSLLVGIKSESTVITKHFSPTAKIQNGRKPKGSAKPPQKAAEISANLFYGHKDSQSMSTPQLQTFIAMGSQHLSTTSTGQADISIPVESFQPIITSENDQSQKPFSMPQVKNHDNITGQTILSTPAQDLVSYTGKSYI